MKPDKNKVAERIKYIKEALGISLSQMAEKIGISKSTLNSYIRALALPPESVVESISDISKYSKEWIYYGGNLEYIKDSLITLGYENFIADFPFVIEDLNKELIKIGEQEYPNIVTINVNFKEKFYYPLFSEYVEKLVEGFSEKVDKHPLKEAGKTYGSERYLKNIWMYIDSEVSYGDEDKILEIAEREYKNWMETFNISMSDSYRERVKEELLNSWILALSTEEGIRDVMNTFSSEGRGSNIEFEELVDGFKEFKCTLERIRLEKYNN